MARVEPVPNAPAATVDLGSESALAVADFHAGIEAALRWERGVELASNAAERRERLLAALDRTDPDRLIVLGDLTHRIGDPGSAEASELDDLLDAVTDRVPVTLVAGNHDGGLAERFTDRAAVDVTPTDGTRLGDVGFVHGHTWPSQDVLGSETICVGHEHPTVRLTDVVGGSRVERAWLRGRLDPAPFVEHFDVAPADLDWGTPELVVFPAFNDVSGGTWVNVEGQEFLSPFLPDALVDGQAYLLDGTRLGDYRRI
jgi:hypothetical protein